MNNLAVEIIMLYLCFVFFIIKTIIFSKLGLDKSIRYFAKFECFHVDKLNNFNVKF